ncbi:MAG: hypothetical protein GX032_00575 [Tenericutes bacterium]|jgi:hypothetical protein|nr:hypothetical protein [Bacilli bacterium]NLV89962.1 hypothetical protein [Mycoplasmatota bacterium]
MWVLVVLMLLALFILFYRQSTSENSYKFIIQQTKDLYERISPYSYKKISEKVKALGLEYSTKEYISQMIMFGGGAAVISYLYFYSIIISTIYVILAMVIVPYLAFLRYKRLYSEYLFEQIQVYTTNTIMEFSVTQSFVKSLEGVYASGILEDPLLSDVKHMIDLSYENGSIDESISYMNTKYDYYMIKNMHQLFLQITKEGSLDSTETLDAMLIDIDSLVEAVYRDRIDRKSFQKSFLKLGVALYFMVMLVQYLLGVDAYIDLLDDIKINLILHLIVLTNSYFLLSGEKYYNENVGAE